MAHLRRTRGMRRSQYHTQKGWVTYQLADGNKRLVLLEFQVPKGGLTKTAVNGLIDALKKVREKMNR